MVPSQPSFTLHSNSLVFPGIQIPIASDIHALSTLEDVQYATEHGVYVVNKETVCERIHFFLHVPRLL